MNDKQDDKSATENLPKLFSFNENVLTLETA